MTNPAVRRDTLFLTVLCGGAGVQHFRTPETFAPLIPPFLPGSARAWTYGSGVVEMVTAALLAVPRTRRFGGRVAGALFLGVFPGNLQMAWNWRTRPWQAQLISLGRLPLQADLVRRAERIHRDG